jgi:hypothetical protein
MLAGELRNQVDRIWDAFWVRGISNPLEVIEQITYLLFLRRLDDLHTLEESKRSAEEAPIGAASLPGTGPRRDPETADPSPPRWTSPAAARPSTQDSLGRRRRCTPSVAASTSPPFLSRITDYGEAEESTPTRRTKLKDDVHRFTDSRPPLRSLGR